MDKLPVYCKANTRQTHKHTWHLREIRAVTVTNNSFSFWCNQQPQGNMIWDVYEFNSKFKQLTSCHLFCFAMPRFLYFVVASC